MTSVAAGAVITETFTTVSVARCWRAGVLLGRIQHGQSHAHADTDELFDHADAQRTGRDMSAALQINQTNCLAKLR